MPPSTANQQQIEWRRDRVLDLSSKGYGVREISRILQISHPTIVRDCAYLREQAKANIGKYIDEQLPTEYHKCLVGITAIMKEAWQMSLDEQSDNREKLQALSLAKDCYAMKLDLLSSATVIARAVKFVDRHRDRGSMPQNGKVVIDDTGEPIENTG